MSRNPGRIRPLEKLAQLKDFLRAYQLEEHHVGDPGYVWLTDAAVCVTVVNPNPNPDPGHLETNDMYITLGKTGMVLTFADWQTSFVNARDHFHFLEEFSLGIIEDRFCAAVLTKDDAVVSRRLVLSERAAESPESVFQADEPAVQALSEGPCVATFTHWDRRDVVPIGASPAAEA